MFRQLTITMLKVEILRPEYCFAQPEVKVSGVCEC